MVVSTQANEDQTQCQMWVLRYPPVVDKPGISKQEEKVPNDTEIPSIERKR